MLLIYIYIITTIATPAAAAITAFVSSLFAPLASITVTLVEVLWVFPDWRIGTEEDCWLIIREDWSSTVVM